MDNIRKRSEQNEHLILSPVASFSDSATRQRKENKCDIRTEFQRDRDRIIHSSSFRRLKHKTQVFLSPEGDHYRTRLTHTLEVAQISRTVARALRLNEDLTEAIALGHDLGHTPFGHAGERALDKLIDGGFKHYMQSVRVCTKLEKQGKGLNLTDQTLDGIMCHTKGTPAKTLEGRIVRLCDQIAYINHDIDDAVRGGIIKPNDIPKEIRAQFGDSKSARIDKMVSSIITNSKNDIIMADEDMAYFNKLHNFLFERVYLNFAAKAEETKVDGIIGGIFAYLVKNPQAMPKKYARVVGSEGIERAVTDYIAGMTDTFAIKFYEDIYIPKSWNI